MEVIDEYLLRTFKKMFRKNENGIAHDWKLLNKEEIEDMYSKKRTTMNKILKNLRHLKVSLETSGEEEREIGDEDSDNQVTTDGRYTELMTY